ncbi:hypothetical protein [Olivibacter sp. XZL3]|uniref:hypothetical protein n=1 Tax=Olivibacter sp. XZL3 TaxID=1735116 RepID=UPI0010662A62|nr:hypothetical protein [Olivibacter sp. XZL3]
MLVADYQLEKTSDITIFFNRYVNFMMLFFPITSFLVVPSVQGTTMTTVLAALLMGLLVILPENRYKYSFFKELFAFVLVFLFFSLVSQSLNLALDLKLSDKLLLVDRGNLLHTFFRSTHITQAMYLVMSFFIYLFVKYYSDKKVITYVYYGLRILCAYGLYEILYFQVTGTTGDFLTNRTFSNEEGSGSLSQMMNVAGFHVLRMKSLTGEPSMFAFTVFPFWALTHALKNRFDNILLLGCLFLTFSTTAYGAMILFQIAWFIYKKKYQKLFYLLGFALVFLFALQIDPVREKMEGVYETVFASKLGGNSGSKQSRSGWITRHYDYWVDVDAPHQLFGIGFGYIRSTDFLTTLLVNCGLLGLITFSAFFFANLLKLRKIDRDIWMCYCFGLIGLFLILMLTVPEFGYPSMWIYLALGHVLVDKSNERTDEQTS